MEIPYIICPRTLVCIHSKVYSKYTTLDLAHQKFAVRYTPRLWLKVYHQLNGRKSNLASAS